MRLAPLVDLMAFDQVHVCLVFFCPDMAGIWSKADALPKKGTYLFLMGMQPLNTLNNLQMTSKGGLCFVHLLTMSIIAEGFAVLKFQTNSIGILDMPVVGQMKKILCVIAGI